MIYHFGHVHGQRLEANKLSVFVSGQTPSDLACIDDIRLVLAGVHDKVSCISVLYLKCFVCKLTLFSPLKEIASGVRTFEGLLWKVCIVLLAK